MEASEFLVSHRFVEELDSLAGIPDEFIVMGSGILGESRRRPGHASLVDEKHVLIGPQ